MPAHFFGLIFVLMTGLEGGRKGKTRNDMTLLQKSTSYIIRFTTSINTQGQGHKRDISAHPTDPRGERTHDQGPLRLYGNSECDGVGRRRVDKRSISYTSNVREVYVGKRIRIDRYRLACSQKNSNYRFLATSAYITRANRILAPLGNNRSLYPCTQLDSLPRHWLFPGDFLARVFPTIHGTATWVSTTPNRVQNS